MEILRAHGVEFDVVNYLETPLARGQLERLLALLGGDPNQLLRRKDALFKAAGLDPAKDYSANEVVDILTRHGHLMERPVVVKGDRAVIARPGEKVKELL